MQPSEPPDSPEQLSHSRPPPPDPDPELLDTPPGPLSSITPQLILIVAIVFLSSFHTGFAIGETNSAQFFVPVDITKFRNNVTHEIPDIVVNSYNKTCGHMNDWFKDCIPLTTPIEGGLEWDAVVSIMSVGGLLGSVFLSGLLAKFVGRKWSLWIICFFSGFAYLLEGLFSNFWALLVGRLLQGIASGVSSGVAPMYLTEIAPKKFRGAFGAVTQIAVTFGIFVSQTLSIATSKGQAWRILFSWLFVVAVFQVIAVPFLPPSPKWLMDGAKTGTKKRNQEYRARRVLRCLRGRRADLDDELIELASEARRGTSAFRMSCGRIVYHAIVGVGLQFIQQFSGVNAVVFYSTLVFQDAKVPLKPVIVTSIVSLVNFLSVLPATILVEKLGRKRLLLIGVFIELISVVILTISMTCSHYVPSWFVHNPKSAEIGFGVVSIIAVIVYTIAFEIALGPIPGFITAEMFTTKIRPFFVSASTSANWLGAFTIGMIFPYMQKYMKHYSFVPFAVVLFLSLFFIAFLVVETKNRSIEEICLVQKSGEVRELESSPLILTVQSHE